MHILSSFSVSMPLTLGQTQPMLPNPVRRACAELSILQVSAGVWNNCRAGRGSPCSLTPERSHCPQPAPAAPVPLQTQLWVPGQRCSSKMCSPFLCMSWSPAQGSTAKCGISFVPLLPVQTEREGKMVLIFTQLCSFPQTQREDLRAFL